MKNKECSDNYDKVPIKLSTLLLLIILIWLASGYVLYYIPEHGAFGDMFGAINALFSGLAFVTLIYTINLQRVELALQRDELSLTRNEIREQKEYLATQNDVLRTQNFENTFFQLLDRFSLIKNSLTFYRAPQIHGDSIFEYIYEDIKKEYRNYRKAHPNINETEIINKISTSYFLTNQTNYGHYYRTLYNLIKLIDKSIVPDKRFYTNLVRAQLTNDEIVILFYDCLSDLGMEKFKPLIEKYALLKVIKPEVLIKHEHYQLYSETAYK